MLKKSLLSLPLIAALSIAAPVSAANYHVVVPAPGKGAPYAAIQVKLSPASLPVGYTGAPYAGFSFNTALQITGDTSLDMNQVSWSAYSGALPQGLTLTNEGSVVGTPTVASASSFQVLAKYKTKSAVGTYAMEVKAERHLVEQAGVRLWSDGTVAQTCKDYIQPTYPYVYAGATGDGVYRIQPADSGTFEVYCDMTMDGGGWTTIQRRFNGQVSFHRNWAEYAAGFGAASGEHWLGLDRIHAMTAAGVELRVDLGRFNGTRFYAQYVNFSVDSAVSKYVLRSGDYVHGTAGDSLIYHLGMKFSTYDADHDTHRDNCAQSYKGGNWFFACQNMNLNAEWYNGPNAPNGTGPRWWPMDPYESLALTEMKIR